MQAKPANTVQSAHSGALHHIGQALALESVMAKTGANPVAQILQHQGDFYEWRDYPEGGVWDHATGYGYFYHAHPGPAFEDEHGHFHLFWSPSRDARINLASLSMDKFGRLIGASAPNRWHVELGEGPDATGRYAQFKVELAFPCFAANQWLGAVIRGLAAPLSALHMRALNLLADPKLCEDRGTGVVAQMRIDLAQHFAALQRPSLKPVKR